MNDKPTIAVTMGDPAGIGAEVALRATARLRRHARFVFVGDRAVLEAAAHRHRVGGEVTIVEVSALSSEERRPGKPSGGGAEAAYRAILRAVELVQRG